MSYENAPVTLTHARSYVCGERSSGKRELEGNLKQTLKTVAALFRAPEEKSPNFAMLNRGREY